MDGEDVASDLVAVKAAIDLLEREDRATLRPWMLAHFDESGDPVRRVHDTASMTAR